MNRVSFTIFPFILVMLFFVPRCPLARAAQPTGHEGATKMQIAPERPVRTLRFASFMEEEFTVTLEQRAALARMLESEAIRNYSGQPYAVVFPPDAQISHHAEFAEDIARLEAFAVSVMAREDIDCILVYDLLSAKALIKHNNGRTPVFILSGDDPVQGNVLASYERSGIPNVTATIEKDFTSKHLWRFHDLLQFKRLGMLYEDSAIGRVSSRLAEATDMAQKLNFELIAVPITTKESRTDCSAAVKKLAEMAPDALFMGSLLCFDPRHVDLQATLLPLSRRGIPALAQDSPLQVQAGALLAITRNQDSRARFNAEKVVRMLKGETPEDLPMQREYRTLLYFNLAVAGKLGFTPSYYLVAASDILFYTILSPKELQAPAVEQQRP